MSDLAVYDCLCQNCKTTFKHQSTLCTSVNFDVKNKTLEQFMTMKLNAVSCPHCNTSFTYETPMVVLSFEHKFAIKTSPSIYPSENISTFNPPHLLLPSGFRFREVYFMIEALEKAKIFSCGLDDVFIEQFKVEYFSNEETMPFDEINLIFSHIDGDSLCFEQYDCDNNLLQTFKKPKIRKFTNIIQTFQTRWNIINRLTITKKSEKENKYV